MKIHPSKFNEAKATQAAAVLLRREGGSMSRLRLLKLLYIANRRMLKEHGRPIIVANASAMKHGPVHSEIYDLINGVRIERAWLRYIRSIGPKIVRLRDDGPDTSLLSKAEVELLNTTCDEMIRYNDWEVVDLTHQFREWRQHYPDPEESTSRPIPLADVLNAVDMGEHADDILHDIEEEAEFRRLFAS